jgi:hypothetical protein
MNPQQIIDKLDQLDRELSETNDRLKNAGNQKAFTQRDYKVSLAKKILELKAEGYPATVINELAKGDEEVSLLRCKRDIAESEYFVMLEVAQNKRARAEIGRSILTWLRCEMEGK